MPRWSCDRELLGNHRVVQRLGVIRRGLIRFRRRSSRARVAFPRRGAGDLLILERPNARGESEEPNEAGGIALLVHVVLAERYKTLIIQGVRALAADDCRRPLVQLERN